VIRLRGWTVVEYWFYSQRNKRFFSSPNLPELLRDSPNFTHVIRTRFSLSRMKWPGRDVGYWPRCRSDLKNAWSYNSISTNILFIAIFTYGFWLLLYNNNDQISHDNKDVILTIISLHYQHERVRRKWAKYQIIMIYWAVCICLRLICYNQKL